MQDYRTGEMVELPELRKMPPPFPPPWAKGRFADRLAELTRSKQFQVAGVEAGIPVEHQGPVFSIDEEVAVLGNGPKCGRFKVRGFDGGLLHLEGMPNHEV